MGTPISCAVPLSLTRLHNTASEAAAILRHTTGKGRKAPDRGSFKRARACKNFFRCNHYITSTFASLLSLSFVKSRGRKAHSESAKMPLKSFILMTDPLYCSPIVQQSNECLSCHDHLPRDISHVIGFSQRRESIDGS